MYVVLRFVLLRKIVPRSIARRSYLQCTLENFDYHYANLFLLVIGDFCKSYGGGASERLRDAEQMQQWDVQAPQSEMEIPETRHGTVNAAGEQHDRCTNSAYTI